MWNWEWAGGSGDPIYVFNLKQKLRKYSLFTNGCGSQDRTDPKTTVFAGLGKNHC